MTMRDDQSKRKTTGTAVGTGADSTVDAMEQQVVAFAEQLGRIVGTVQAKAEGWLDRDALNAQIASVRDSAAQLLEQLGRGNRSSAGNGERTSNASSAKQSDLSKPVNPSPQGARSAQGRATQKLQTGRSGGVVDAPGKRHRKPAPDQSVPKSGESRVARMKIANANRKRGRG